MSTTATTTIVSKKGILAALVYWGVKQSPYLYPKNLLAAFSAVEKRLDEKKIFPAELKRSPLDYAEMDSKELKDLIKDLVHNTPEVAVWNLTQYEIDKGFTDPKDEKRPVKFASASRYGSDQQADHDFIDLDALAQNIYTQLTKDE